MSTFTGHNIALGEEQTMGDSAILLSESNFWKSVKETVELFYPGPQHENAKGYRGRWYKEWARGTAENKVNKMLWASHGNSSSFWLLKRDLIKALYAVGFDHVFEPANFTGDDLAADNYLIITIGAC